MPSIAPSFVQVHPSYYMPEAIVQQSQRSGAFELFPSGAPMARLSEGDLYAYINRFEMRSTVSAAQVAANSIPSAEIVASQISTASYLLRVRAEWDHHDVAAWGQWNISLPDAQRLAMRQGIFQQLRIGALYGFTPSNGEGLITTAGATAVNLPPDQMGNTTFSTYDNGAMAQFFLQQLSSIKTRTLTMGQPSKFVVIAPQRILGGLTISNIVQLVQYQRPGAGTATSAGTVTNVMAELGDDIRWTVDDTLINKGSGGNTDAIIVLAPELETQGGRSGPDTNEFAKLGPNLRANTLMLTDMAAPREIPTPLAGGATDVVAEMRSTSGWGLRPEAITIISMAF